MLNRVIKSNFVKYQIPQLNTQIQYLFVFSIYVFGVLGVYKAMGNPLYVLCIAAGLFALTIIIYPIGKHITWRRSDKSPIDLNSYDKKDIEGLASIVQDKVTRHELMAFMFMRLNMLEIKIKKSNALSFEKKMEFLMEIYKSQIHILEHFAQEGHRKGQQISPQGFNVPSI